MEKEQVRNHKFWVGVMYTTWIDDFSQLENWARTIWKGCDNITLNRSNESNSILSLYPNPAINQVNINLREGLKIANIQLIDTEGTVVLDQQGYNTSRTFLPTSSISSGTYILVIQTHDPNISFYEKLTIQNSK